jgi:hypothetical protein
VIGRRVVAAVLAVLAALAGTFSPLPARADWTPLDYQFCDGRYTQDELQYVTQPVLAVYSVTFGEGGFFQIAPSSAWQTDESRWSVDARGFATVPISFTQRGQYLLFFEYTPFVFDDRYYDIDSQHVGRIANAVFYPDGVYTPVFLNVVTSDGLAVANDTEVQFPGWSDDTNPYEALTESGNVTLACVGKMRQVLPRPYAIPNLLNIFIESSQGSFCSPLTWGLDARSPVVLTATVTPGGCSELSSGSASQRRR